MYIYMTYNLLNYDQWKSPNLNRLANSEPTIKTNFTNKKWTNYKRKIGEHKWIYILIGIRCTKKDK